MKVTKKMKEEGGAKVVTEEDEKYRLGYGVAGRGVKLPWYLERRREDVNAVNANANANGGASPRGVAEEGKRSGKKTVEELREERLRRERREKERERALLMLMDNNRRDTAPSAFVDTNYSNTSASASASRRRIRSRR